MENDDEILLIREALAEQEAREMEYTAVLGGSDETHCSYSKGYVKRQAIYACLTCTPDTQTNPEKRAGICLACSFKCHDSHDLVELYTKRNFRCDCGNSKFSLIKCELISDKDAENTLNKYGQNFSGIYCVCHRPHPDPECEIEDTQIQCTICEDWFHEKHLKVKVPTTYSEMICADCMDAFEFLKSYSGLMIMSIDNLESDETNNTSMDDTGKTDENNEVDITTELKEGTSTNATESETNGEPTPKKIKLDDTVCKKPLIRTGSYEKGPSFWTDDWRRHLCRCDVCKKSYEELNVQFLLDDEDTVEHYENIGKMKANEIEREVRELQERTLSSMGRTAQVELLHGLNNLKDRLREFFQSFGENHVITEADVKHFFAEMKKNDEKVKEKFGGPPSYHCR